MAKTLRTSGDYTIKAGDGFDSGSGTNTITLDSLNVSVNGNLTVGGSSTTVSTTNTTIEDNIIELNTGASANTNNAGIIIERGSAGDNAAIVWKEDTDSFIVGTTTATAADKSSSISVTAGALQTGALTATTGTFSGALTCVGFTVEGNITAGSVTTNEITANGSNAALTVASSGTGDITLDAGGDVILDVDNADLILKDAGTEFGRLSRVTADFVIKASAQDQDLIFKGNDGGATVSALTLDMSEDGAATFNSTVTATDITANSLTTNTITSNGSNAELSLQASGTGDVIVSALRVNGTTLDSADSTKITVAEAVDVTGTLFSRGNVFGVQTLTGSGSTEVVNLTDTVTLLVTTGGSQAFSLADGVEGQIKIISMKTDGGSGIVTPANFVNGTRITFDDVEDTVTLLYQSTGWVALARQNATFS
tara:strand:+ start:561 stop:1835 length:1275 start_codon:yes stop_codon:yes gene_type:complete